MFAAWNTSSVFLGYLYLEYVYFLEYLTAALQGRAQRTLCTLHDSVFIEYRCNRTHSPYLAPWLRSLTECECIVDR